jgi:hypothetical protein
MGTDLTTTQSLFPVYFPSTRSADENIRAMEPFCHVVEVKGPFALVHASPNGVLKITELGLEVFHAKRGGEYYAVRIGRNAVVIPMVRQTPAQTTLLLKGQSYLVEETKPKRRQDIRRFEVTKDDGESAPYVVSFQSEDGRKCACSCKDWIYRRHQCKHIRGVVETFAALPAARAVPALPDHAS